MLLSFFAAFFISHGEAAEVLSCRPVSEKILQLWSERHGLKPDVAISDLLQPVHQELLQDLSTNDSRQRQTEFEQKIFDTAVWFDRVKPLREGNSQALTSLFRSWIREQYIRFLQQKIRRAELRAMSSSRTPEKLKTYLSQLPTSYRVVRIFPYQCQTPEEQRYYPCGESHLAVDVQYSPSLFCYSVPAALSAQVRFILRTLPDRSMKIVDIEIDGARIYLTSALNLESLAKTKEMDDLVRYYQQVTFTNSKSVSDLYGISAPAIRSPASNAK